MPQFPYHPNPPTFTNRLLDAINKTLRPKICVCPLGHCLCMDKETIEKIGTTAMYVCWTLVAVKIISLFVDLVGWPARLKAEGSGNGQRLGGGEAGGGEGRGGARVVK